MAFGAGGEQGAPGCPREQLKLTVASPLLVVRLRAASPSEAQNFTNTFTEAAKNWDFDRANILSFVKSSNI